MGTLLLALRLWSNVSALSHDWANLSVMRPHPVFVTPECSTNSKYLWMIQRIPKARNGSEKRTKSGDIRFVHTVWRADLSWQSRRWMVDLGFSAWGVKWRGHVDWMEGSGWSGRGDENFDFRIDVLHAALAQLAEAPVSRSGQVKVQIFYAAQYN